MRNRTVKIKKTSADLAGGRNERCLSASTMTLWLLYFPRYLQKVVPWILREAISYSQALCPFSKPLWL